jgi:hypothetical protein
MHAESIPVTVENTFVDKSPILVCHFETSPWSEAPEESDNTKILGCSPTEYSRV